MYALLTRPGGGVRLIEARQRRPLNLVACDVGRQLAVLIIHGFFCSLPKSPRAPVAPADGVNSQRLRDDNDLHALLGVSPEALSRDRFECGSMRVVVADPLASALTSDYADKRWGKTSRDNEPLQKCVHRSSLDVVMPAAGRMPYCETRIRFLIID